MTFNCQRGKQLQGGPTRTRQADSPVISEYTNLKRLLVVWREKGSTQHDGVKYVLHIRSEVKLETSVNSALFRFTKGLVLEIPFSDELLDYLHAVSEVPGPGA